MAAPFQNSIVAIYKLKTAIPIPPGKIARENKGILFLSE